MALELEHRPPWKIDILLDGLIGQDVRVAAKSFSPGSCAGNAPPRFIPVRNLFLPDNSQPGRWPVFCEGRRRQFERQTGVVWVQLEAPASPGSTPEGLVFFRGKAAVLLRGPALVVLAFPFRVERLPADPANYWRDFRVPRAQFELPFAPSPTNQKGPAVGHGETKTTLMSGGYRRAVDSPPPPRWMLEESNTVMGGVCASWGQAGGLETGAAQRQVR